MRAAVLTSNGQVVNVIVTDDDALDPGPGLSLHVLADDDAVGIGWSRIDDQWVAPPEPPTPGPSLQDQMDALILDSLDTTAALQQQIDDLILALLG